MGGEDPATSSAGGDPSAFDGVIDLGPGGVLRRAHLSGETVRLPGPDDPDTRRALLLGMHHVGVHRLLAQLNTAGLASSDLLAVLRRRVSLLMEAQASLDFKYTEMVGSFETRRIAVPALARGVAMLRENVLPRLRDELAILTEAEQEQP